MLTHHVCGMGVWYNPMLGRWEKLADFRATRRREVAFTVQVPVSGVSVCVQGTEFARRVSVTAIRC